MRILTKIFLAFICLFFMERTVYAMQGEEEKDIASTRSKSYEFTRKKEKQLALDDSSQGLASEEGKIALPSSQNPSGNEQIDAEVLDRNVTNLTASAMGGGSPPNEGWEDSKGHPAPRMALAAVKNLWIIAETVELAARTAYYYVPRGVEEVERSPELPPLIRKMRVFKNPTDIMRALNWYRINDRLLQMVLVSSATCLRCFIAQQQEEKEEQELDMTGVISLVPTDIVSGDGVEVACDMSAVQKTVMEFVNRSGGWRIEGLGFENSAMGGDSPPNEGWEDSKGQPALRMALQAIFGLWSIASNLDNAAQVGLDYRMGARIGMSHARSDSEKIMLALAAEFYYNSSAEHRWQQTCEETLTEALIVVSNGLRGFVNDPIGLMPETPLREGVTWRKAEVSGLAESTDLTGIQGLVMKYVNQSGGWKTEQ